MPRTTPRTALILYYSFTQQTRRVAEAMAAGLESEGWRTKVCAIEITDPKFAMYLPFRPFWPRLLGLLIPQLLGRTCAFRLADDVEADDFDLVCIGSPTWWFKPAMPIVSFLRSALAGRILGGRPFAVFTVARAMWGHNLRCVRRGGEAAGGRFAGSAAFVFEGNDLQSGLSFIQYMQHQRNTERYAGCRIYPFGVPERALADAQGFGSQLAAENAAPEDAAPEDAEAVDAEVRALPSTRGAAAK